VSRHHIGYTLVIQSFKHKGLEKFFITGNKSGIQAQHADRLRLILGGLNAATVPEDMRLPGLELHHTTFPIQGKY
jgi:proteic killer suppression protein